MSPRGKRPDTVYSEAYLKSKWKKGQTGNPKGSSEKQRFVGEVAAMTAKQMAQIGTCLITCNVERLKEIAIDPNASVLEVWISSCVLHGIRVGDYRALDVIATRIVGKPKETMEITARQANPMDLLTTEEKEAKLRELLGKTKMLASD